MLYDVVIEVAIHSFPGPIQGASSCILILARRCRKEPIAIR